MKKRPEIFFKHMLMAIEKIEEYTSDMDESSFKNDSKTADAVIRQFEIIGEAARNISASLVADSPISWDKITGLRNKLIHDYFGVDIDIVWQTAKEGTIPLKKYLLTKVK
ncbi:MAG: DUF86 domain-containing protein [Deltaproteobacteria bacterium]|nr:DUF86 domain-containing protein [Deltaproteobacteria bacterium]MBI2341624.1 DUF86 domain-containing protein [Deltaproteobacteria bacterium]MBI2974268.1 DUF86 domain-containing protein [Deltaproteobacteria bacterium]